MYGKSKRKFGAVALAALCAVTLFALQGCTISPDDLAKKITAESSNFTMTITAARPDGVATEAVVRVNGTYFCMKQTSEDVVTYDAILKDSEKYYRVYGTDAKYYKKEITEEEFKNDATMKQIVLQKNVIGNYKTYFEERDGVYKLKADKMLDYANLTTGAEYAELTEEQKAEFEKVSLEFDNTALKLTTETADVKFVITISDVGYTKLERFTETEPIDLDAINK